MPSCLPNNECSKSNTKARTNSPKRSRGQTLWRSLIAMASLLSIGAMCGPRMSLGKMLTSTAVNRRQTGRALSFLEMVSAMAR